jgi:urease accessory protein
MAPGHEAEPHAVSQPLMRLLQLSSPALPVGAYTYSQGLEWAVEQGTVHDEASAQAWIGAVQEGAVARFEAPWVAQLLAAWLRGDDATLGTLDAEFLASRESAELRAETLQMGHSLRRLLLDLPDFPSGHAARLCAIAEPSYPLAWSCAASAWEIPAHDALCGYLWSWAENQVMAALKSVPLGQSAGQRMLAILGTRMPALAAAALQMSPEETSNFAPGFAIASSRHETQYTRLFRS